MGLGKPRSSLGEFLDRHDISQEELSMHSGLTRQTISYLCKSGNQASPTENTVRKVIGALRRMGQDVEFADFWG